MRNVSGLWANTRIVCIPLQTSRGGVVQPQSASCKRTRARAGLEWYYNRVSLSLPPSYSPPSERAAPEEQEW